MSFQLRLFLFEYFHNILDPALWWFNQLGIQFCSKNIELAASTDGAGVAIIQGNGDMTLKVPMTLKNTVAFLQNMKLRYNDSLGTRDIVTFLRTDFVEDMRLKCKIRLSTDAVILVDIETLNFIENPDISSIPETSQEYFRESTVITPSQLEHILHLKGLSPLQEEMMSHHTRLHHVPFSTVNCYGRIGWNTMSSCIFKKTLSNLCSMLIQPSTHMSLVI